MKQEIALQAKLIDGRFRMHFILFYFKFLAKYEIATEVIIYWNVVFKK